MKNKDYYFKHDYNPTNDPKIVCLLGNHGGLGYGTFWRIIELLHQERDHKLPHREYIYEAIAKQMLASAKQISDLISDCINTYELFVSDGDYFWSNRVIDNINKQEEISEIRQKAGRAGAIAKQNLAKPTNKSKVNKIKELPIGNALITGDKYTPDNHPPKRKPRPLKSEKQKTAFSALKLIDYFKDQAMAVHRKSYLTRKEDRNPQIRRQAKSCVVRFGDNCKDYVDWFLSEDDNAWTKYEPAHCFSTKHYQLYENRHTSRKPTEAELQFKRIMG